MHIRSSSFASLACLALLVVGCSVDRTYSNGTGGGGGGVPVACSAGHACASGTCVDGFCCDTACEGTCEACNVTGHEGNCTPVTVPVAPRDPCPGAGTECAGTCDGTKSDCSFPPSTTICGAACDGTCGQGVCSSAAGGTCPNGFACGTDGGCKTTCGGDGDCQQFFTCDLMDSTCKRVPESDCFDGADNNGDGLADCMDPSCTDTTECVPNGDGNDLGVVQPGTGACSDEHYPSGSQFHSDLQQQACTGCGCNSICTGAVNFYTTTNCTGTAHSRSYSGAATGSSADMDCQYNGSTFYQSASLGAASPTSCRVIAGTPNQPPPVWGADEVFCKANTTPTCQSPNQVCVAKRSAGTHLCVAVGEQDSCPTGYTDGTADTYYQDYDAGSCGACSSCTKGTTLTCGQSLLSPIAWHNTNCQGGADFAGIAASGCTQLTNESWQSVGGGFINGNTDDCSVNYANIVPPTPKAGMKFCCQMN